MEILTKQAIELGRAFDASKENAIYQTQQSQTKTASVEVPTMDELTKIIAREIGKLKESIKGAISSHIATQLNNTTESTQQPPTYTPPINSNYRGNNFNSNYRGGRRGTHGRGLGNYHGANNNANGTYFTQPQQTTNQGEQYYNAPNNITPNPNPQPYNNNLPNFNPPFYNINNNAPPYLNAPNYAQNTMLYPNTSPQITQNNTQDRNNYNRGGYRGCNYRSNYRGHNANSNTNYTQQQQANHTPTTTTRYLKQCEQQHQLGKLPADGVNGIVTPSTPHRSQILARYNQKAHIPSGIKPKKGNVDSSYLTRLTRRVTLDIG